MTPELQERLQAGAKPFNGTVVATYDEPELSLVLEMLRFAVTRLSGESEQVAIFADWHEHDGFLTSPTQITWSDFAARLSDTESLYQSRSADDYVRIAIFPMTFDWLLRYNIQDSEPGHDDAWCSFDFTCSPDSPSFDLIDQLRSKWGGYLDLSEGKDFFDGSYSG